MSWTCFLDVYFEFSAKVELNKKWTILNENIKIKLKMLNIPTIQRNCFISIYTVDILGIPRHFGTIDIMQTLWE